MHRRRVDGAASLDDHRRFRLGLAQSVAGDDRISSGVFGADVQNVQGDVAEIVEQMDATGLEWKLNFI